MVDKGYYDYDYEDAQSTKPKVVTDWEDTVLSDEESKRIAMMFGIGRKKIEGLENIQNHILKQIKEED